MSHEATHVRGWPAAAGPGPAAGPGARDPACPPDQIGFHDHTGPRLGLLGCWSLTGTRTPPSGAGRRVLTFVALRGPVDRDELAGTLWPDSSEERAHGCLRTALWRLRSHQSGLLRDVDGFVALSPGVTVDVDDLLRDLRLLQAGHLPDVLRSLPPYLLSGDLLPG